MTWLDFLVLGIFALCIIGGAWRGFIRTVLGFANLILAIFLTNLLYPHMGRFLRGIDGLFESLSTSIGRLLGLDYLVEQRAGEAYGELIQSLPLPQVMLNALYENSTPVVHNALGALNINEYISNFLAGIVINIISLVIVFVLVIVALTFLARALNLVARLPVIKELNRLLGGLLGGLMGLLVTWVVLAVVVVYLSANSAVDVVYLLDNSPIARPIHEINFITNFILRIFP
ncbi:MAG: CvpA family protein [Defluviitaleaceae bacterium]|nr:CvpA family protein [Defluviitaleaceae bacterium]